MFKYLGRNLKNFFYFLSIILVCNSCGPRIIQTPATSPTTITINNVLANCHNPINNLGEIIAYKAFLTVYHHDGNDKRQLDYVEFTSSTTHPETALVFNTKLPTSVVWSFKVVIEGVQCTTCAVQYFPGDVCLQQVTSTGIIGAKPRYETGAGPRVGHVASITFDFTNRDQRQNVSASCGCIVPF